MQRNTKICRLNVHPTEQILKSKDATIDIPTQTVQLELPTAKNERPSLVSTQHSRALPIPVSSTPVQLAFA